MVTVVDRDGMGRVVRQTEHIERCPLHEAAPEMLKALEDKLADCRVYGECQSRSLQPGEYCSNECIQMDAAVRKAKGQG